MVGTKEKVNTAALKPLDKCLMYELDAPWWLIPSLSLWGSLWCWCCAVRHVCQLYAEQVGYDPRYRGGSEMYLCTGLWLVTEHGHVGYSALAWRAHCAFHRSYAIVLPVDTASEPKLTTGCCANFEANIAMTMRGSQDESDDNASLAPLSGTVAKHGICEELATESSGDEALRRAAAEVVSNNSADWHCCRTGSPWQHLAQRACRSLSGQVRGFWSINAGRREIDAIVIRRKHWQSAGRGLVCLSLGRIAYTPLDQLQGYMDRVSRRKWPAREQWALKYGVPIARIFSMPWGLCTWERWLERRSKGQEWRASSWLALPFVPGRPKTKQRQEEFACRTRA